MHRGDGRIFEGTKGIPEGEVYPCDLEASGRQAFGGLRPLRRPEAHGGKSGGPETLETRIRI